jgi:hypothetical protein
MATTTPNYGWTVPTSTDLVKDGATAIETLGDAIDASMNTALGTKKAGMVLLNTTSFSAVASQSVNSVFTSTYDNYKIVCYISNFTGSDTDLRFRLRASGTDYTTGNHYIGNINGSFPSSISFSSTTSDTSGYIGRGGTSTNNTFFADLSSPQLAVNKQMTVTSFRQFSAFGLNVTSSTFPTSSSYDGFSLIPVSGNISGIVSVYGYNK